jgi:hypothetical protein
MRGFFIAFLLGAAVVALRPSEPSAHGPKGGALLLHGVDPAPQTYQSGETIVATVTSIHADAAIMATQWMVPGRDGDVVCSVRFIMEDGTSEDFINPGFGVPILYSPGQVPGNHSGKRVVEVRYVADNAGPSQAVDLGPWAVVGYQL